MGIACGAEWEQTAGLGVREGYTYGSTAVKIREYINYTFSGVPSVRVPSSSAPLLFSRANTGIGLLLSLKETVSLKTLKML